ncbi:MAG TPA: hypothetical protein V6D17_03815, partial [Candidatus Obscuribacterales bacterium]
LRAVALQDGGPARELWAASRGDAQAAGHAVMGRQDCEVNRATMSLDLPDLESTAMNCLVAKVAQDHQAAEVGQDRRKVEADPRPDRI